MTFLFIAFIAGVLTVLAPCILPLLPVIVGHSLSDSTTNRRRLFVVVLSLSLSVIVFTLLLKISTLFINIPQDLWKWISGGIIFFFGLTMLFPSLWEKFSFANTLSLKSNKVLTKGYQKDNIWGDVIIGASLGPIFSACSPTYFVILATVLPVSPILGLVYLLAYVFGLSLSLVAIALLGQRIMTAVSKVSDSRGWFKKIFGIIFILVALAIITGYDKKFQVDLLDAGFFDVTKVEQELLEADSKKNEAIVDTLGINKDSEEDFLSLKEKSKQYVVAPDLSSIDGYINTDGEPISISQYKGKKVVLLDIWTYSCINCQRTIPYLNEWYKKYEDEGLVIIGLHTPEFSFEKVEANVAKAVKGFDIKYPVVLDNDFSTWNAYKNQYWPRKYLIDIDGYIVYDHAGEGDYEESEKKIQEALQERNARLATGVKVEGGVANPTNKIVVDGRVESPEIYFGSSRNEYLDNGNAYTNGSQTLTIPAVIKPNKLYLGGTWNFSPEYASNAGEGTVIFKYTAKNVYFVGSSLKGAKMEVYIDGVRSKTVSVKDETLYTLVEGQDYKEHTLELKIKSPGIEAFTFTFG